MLQLDPRLLIIDDNPAIADDIIRVLRPLSQQGGELEAAEALLFGNSGNVTAMPEWQIDIATQGEEGVQKVRDAAASGQRYALAFVDMWMPPGWDGLKTITHLWEIDPHVQVVICSAFSDYSWTDIRAQLGHTDNLLVLKKPFDVIEVQQLAVNMTRKWQLAEHARARFVELERSVELRSAELRQSEERFSVAFKAAPYPQAILCFTSGAVVDVNDAFCSMIGFSRAELKEHSTPLLQHTHLMDALQQPHPILAREVKLVARDGTPRHVKLSTQPTTIAGGPHLILMAEDTTGQKQLEAQLMHAQRMEAVGQLAAGVAHDFNNILTIVKGNLSLQLASPQQLPPDTMRALTESLAASERAATLTRHLLTFSRKQLFNPEPLDLNALISADSAMLKRLLPESIALSWDCQPGIPAVVADASGISQMVVNLVINARDAMSAGGMMRVSTVLVEISERQATQSAEARPGHFVRLSVTDTGTGMDEQTKARIFEPFFTTKEVGQGSGMGLASVYGIVQQHEGWIEVFSDIGQGTTFFIYLPISATPASAALEKSQPVRLQANLNVLLVEDEPAVRDIMRQVLVHCGCRVIEAGDAMEGYEKWSAHKNQIDLLVTDIVMPGGATGHDLARQLREERPDLKVIFSSGYSADLFQQGSELVPGRNFLPKPYDAATVVKIIHRVADERSRELKEMLSS